MVWVFFVILIVIAVNIFIMWDRKADELREIGKIVENVKKEVSDD